MKYHLSRFFLSFLLFFVVSSAVIAQTSEEISFGDITWKTQDVAPGVVYRYHHFEDLFGGKQSVSVLEVELNRSDIRVGLAHFPRWRVLTSRMAEENQAVAAINGTFFDMLKGGAVNHLRVDGKDIHFDDPRSPGKGGAIAVGSGDEVKILRESNQGWEKSKAKSFMGAGPILLWHGALTRLPINSFNRDRHPRAAIGVTPDRQLILVVVDGRHGELALGMTTRELAQTMKALGCNNALNLDGGGSSTMWIKNNGGKIVNYPSDNKNFDHEGERRVANAVLIFSTSGD